MNIKILVFTLLLIAMLTTTAAPAFAEPAYGLNFQCVKWNLQHMAQAKGYGPEWYQRIDRFTQTLSWATRGVVGLNAHVRIAIFVARSGLVSVPWAIAAVTSCWS